MIRRLIFILVAATQIAALPLSINPSKGEVGMPLTITITLPGETSELVGFPDIEPFALLSSSERSGNKLTLRLLPLRSGEHAIPSFSFQTGQHRDSTTVTRLTIEAPEPPKEPHPLRSFPEPEQPLRPTWLWLPLTSGCVTLLLLLFILIRRRTAIVLKQLIIEKDRFSELAAAAEKIRIDNDSAWDLFYQRLDRARFAPGPHDPNELPVLIKEFEKLRGETP